MNSILILISSSPGSSHALEALKLACNMKHQGREVAVYLLQDAIYHALPNGLRQGGAYDGSDEEKEISCAIEALKLARNLKHRGREVADYLLQEATYNDRPNGLQQGGSYDRPDEEEKISWYCLEEDLAMRGYQREDKIPRVRLSNYDELVEMMTERYDKTIGIF